jgi:hypothetical protein
VALLGQAPRQESEKETIREERTRFDRLERKIEALTAPVEAQRRVPEDWAG